MDASTATATASTTNAPPRAAARLERTIGRVVGAESGPTVICVGGVHGNEPSGVLALERIVARLRSHPGALRGEFLALRGNLAALERKVRYVERDLNRAWTVERVEELRAMDRSLLATEEDRQQMELLDEIDAATARARGSIIFLDLHSTSGGGSPFSVLADTLRNRELTIQIPAPNVLGLEEELRGTFLAYMTDLGHVGAAFEAGQHDDPRAVDHAEATIWLILEKSGCLNLDRIRVPTEPLRLLKEATAGLPPVMENRYRHPVEPGDGFRMVPGFQNFQAVEEGRVLAWEGEQEIRAPESGLILMPLYQPQGDDGFFIVRSFSSFWLWLSERLRRARADRIVHWLPGVRRHPSLPHTYLVNRHVARWYALEVFHLLGFRRHGVAGSKLTVSRRPHDLAL